MRDETSKKRWRSRAKVALKVIGVSILFALGALEVLWEDTDVVGGLGMDDSGRQVLCQTLDAGLDKSMPTPRRVNSFATIEVAA